jgi:hypothetical protein
MADISAEQLTRWADDCVRISHLNSLVQRHARDGSRKYAVILSERARRCASELLNELVAAGASPKQYDNPEEI